MNANTDTQKVAPAANNTKVEKVKTTLQITCTVTGKSRLTNMPYLEAKAARLGTTVQDIIRHYANRDSLKLLRAGKTVAEVRAALGTEGTVKDISEKMAKRIVELNGKHKVAKEAPAPAPAAA